MGISRTSRRASIRLADFAKLKALRVAIKAGTDALDRDDFVEVDNAELDGYLEGLTADKCGR
jgi:hypothetical protein